MRMIKLALQQPFQTVFTILTNCNNLARLLTLKYGGYLSASTKIITPAITAILNEKHYIIEFSGNTYTTLHPLSEIDSILFDHTSYGERIFAIHGTAVEWQKKAYLFLASTTSGKTTLASYLAAKGFGYITDDCILLDKKSFQIHPFCTPIHLRPGGLDVLRHYNAAPAQLEYIDEPTAERYVYTPDNCISTPVPLGKIFFISRTSDNQLLSMNATQRMQALMKSPITDYPVTPTYLRFLSSLAQLDCFQLHYKDMTFVEEVLRE